MPILNYHSTLLDHDKGLRDILFQLEAFVFENKFSDDHVEDVELQENEERVLFVIGKFLH